MERVSGTKNLQLISLLELFFDLEGAQIRLILSHKIFLEAELTEEGSAWEIPGDKSSGSAHTCSHINIIVKTLTQTLLWRGGELLGFKSLCRGQAERNDYSKINLVVLPGCTCTLRCWFNIIMNFKFIFKS